MKINPILEEGKMVCKHCGKPKIEHFHRWGIPNEWICPNTSFFEWDGRTDLTSPVKSDTLGKVETTNTKRKPWKN